MSIETWKEEFYPVEANKVGESDAASHSLRKWRGLTKENLEKHGVKKYHHEIVDKNNNEKVFRVDDSSCALCKYYFKDFCFCTDCPLVKLLGFSCDEKRNAPYQKWVFDGDPQPMITLLERIVSEQEEASKNDKQKFSEHLDKATESVSKWPSWKQRLLVIVKSEVE